MPFEVKRSKDKGQAFKAISIFIRQRGSRQTVQEDNTIQTREKDYNKTTTKNTHDIITDSTLRVS